MDFVLHFDRDLPLGGPDDLPFLYNALIAAFRERDLAGCEQIGPPLNASFSLDHRLDEPGEQR